MNTLRWCVAVASLAGAAATATAQEPQAPPPALPIPAVGDVAPDFAFRPINREGVAAEPKKLSDYRGQTVVLWFFVKARTRG